MKVNLPTFTDVTQEAGVQYRNVCGDEVTDYLIQVKGGDVRFFDYNNDGDLDLNVANEAGPNFT